MVRHYAEDLGYEYMSASNKEEFNAVYDRFVTPTLTDKPMIFEVFTDNECESDALRLINNLELDRSVQLKSTLKESVRDLLGDDLVNVVKKYIKR